MKTLATSILATAVAAALATAGAPAFAQSSPYDAPDAPYPPQSAPGAPQAPQYAPPPPSQYASPAPSSPQASQYAPPPPSYGAPAQGGAYGRVLSSTPVTAQITVRHQECVDQPGVVRAQPSGIGTLIGAALGGLVGNQFGAGGGRALATGAGVIAGAVAGNNIESANAPNLPTTVTNCSYPASRETRVIGYDVVYEVNGQRYSTRTQQDPGPQIALDVRGAGNGATPQEIVAAANSVPPPPPAYAYPAPYPVYGYPAPVYYGPPPISIGFGFRGRWH